MGEIVKGRIVGHDERGVTIYAPCPDVDRALRRGYNEVLIEYQDGRTLSPDQRKKAHALIAEIADWSGDTPDWIKRHMKLEFMADRLESLEKKIFSLSNADMTTVREFISFLTEFILRFDIPTKVPLIELCDDIERYVYACLMNKKCSVCGQRAQMHHWVHLGMGADRTETYQLGWPVIALCAQHHREAHDKGRAWLENDMHLMPVPLDAAIGKVYKMTRKALGLL